MAAKRQADMKAPSPIVALASVGLEELTWLEVLEANWEGKTTALILTGGVESNGPFVATGEPNFILEMGKKIV